MLIVMGDLGNPSPLPPHQQVVQVGCESWTYFPAEDGWLNVGPAAGLQSPRPTPYLAATAAFCVLAVLLLLPLGIKYSFFSPPLPFKKNIPFQERIWLQFQLIPIRMNLKDALIFSLSNCERRKFLSLYESFRYEHKGWGKLSGLEKPAHPLKPHHADSLPQVERAYLGRSERRNLGNNSSAQYSICKFRQ